MVATTPPVAVDSFCGGGSPQPGGPPLGLMGGLAKAAERRPGPRRAKLVPVDALSPEAAEFASTWALRSSSESHHRRPTRLPARPELYGGRGKET